MPNLGEGSKFLRADSAQQVGINRGFAMPCSVPGADPCGQAWRLCQHAQAFSHKLMVAEALKGEAVIRIKGGDPFVFGRGGERRVARGRGGRAGLQRPHRRPGRTRGAGHPGDRSLLRAGCGPGDRHAKGRRAGPDWRPWPAAP